MLGARRKVGTPRNHRAPTGSPLSRFWANAPLVFLKFYPPAISSVSPQMRFYRQLEHRLEVPAVDVLAKR